MRTIVLIASLCALSLGLQSAAPCAESPKKLWDTVVSRWESIDNLTCDLFTYISDQRIMKKPDGAKKLESEPYTGVYNLKYTFKKPKKILMEFTTFEDSRKDKEIISKIASETPHLAVAFGWLNDTDVYARFSPIGKDSMGVNAHLKNNVFQAPRDGVTMESVDLSLVHTLGDLMKLRLRYFEDGSVTVKKEKYFVKAGFGMAEGKVVYKDEESEQAAYVFTFIPKDPAKNNGITKELVMIDPEMMFPVQAEVYRGNTLIYCMKTWNVKLNPGISDGLWKKFYAGATIVKTQTMKGIK